MQTLRAILWLIRRRWFRPVQAQRELTFCRLSSCASPPGMRSEIGDRQSISTDDNCLALLLHVREEAGKVGRSLIDLDEPHAPYC